MHLKYHMSHTHSRSNDIDYKLSDLMEKTKNIKCSLSLTKIHILRQRQHLFWANLYGINIWKVVREIFFFCRVLKASNYNSH